MENPSSCVFSSRRHRWYALRLY